ncbi:MAG: transporter substrate-binding domain-containing protein [Oceanicaulis sp.]
MCAISGNKLLAALAALVFAAGTASARQAAPETVDVYTGVWPPYVEAQGAAPGPVTEIVRTVFDDMGYEPRVRRFGFAYVYDQVERGRAMAAYPFFETDDRIGEVLFSDPVFEVTSRIYYNRRAHPDGPPTLTGEEIYGNVSGYRFGGEIDRLLAAAEADGRVEPFENEQEALAALIDGEIELLPITGRVAREVLRRDFASERALIAALPQVDDEAQPLKVIFPPGADAMRDAFNASLARLQQAELIPLGDRRTGTLAGCDTVAEIVASDDVPLVLATNPLTGDRYALPQGSRVAVCGWSTSMTEAAGDNRFYAIMSDTSEVLVLDGPQAGRELLVENMHLAISE